MAREVSERISNEEGVTPLFECLTLEERCKYWEKVSNLKLNAFNEDLTIYEQFDEIMARIRPDIIIHYAEQPSAPYSMKDFQAAKFTLDNNFQRELVHFFPIFEDSCEF